MTRHASHDCAIVGSFEERLELVASFLTSAVPEGATVLVGCPSVAQLADDLRAWDIDLDELERTGRVVALRARPDPAVELALRAVGTATPPRLLVWGRPWLVARESVLGELARGAEILCLYTAWETTPEHRARLGSLHDVVRSVPSLYDDGLLRVTEGPDGELLLAGECDLSNVSALAEVFESHLAAAPRIVDVGRLRFADVRTVRLLAGLVDDGAAAGIRRARPLIGALLGAASSVHGR
ncbi:hypothetical protein PSU4_48080 [Pseudonocardia sulfidoxydans NBRC 16205]|uniref:Uncharacterized protein n=1 Tax=Pseudonocardia sulfidoxydans NBRC 16205 TaxID=1223511 RepID=A0A511DQ33_9PSEU|nr:hypothetical protein [Pseudonocardia sulfidoxydans]GEL25854.1 hypothetical protein PSU4_48080 [Pseudonocardia sulfidoxydans NBRC 16205]